MASAIIIGGGPAGSLAGLLLARAGFSVRLLEQHAFPRDKVCGECLSALGIDVLERAGVSSKLEPLSPVRLTRTLLHPLDGPTIEVPLPRVMWGLTRHAMDLALLNAAVVAGVTLLQPARCERVIWNQMSEDGVDAPKPETQTGRRNNPSVVWRDLKTNSVVKTSADWVIVADGKGSFLGRPAVSSGDLGIKTHFKNVNGPRDAIELFAGYGHYGGFAAVESGRWNAAFSVPSDRVRASGGDIQKLFDQITRQIPSLSERLRGATRSGAWLASPLPRAPVSKRWPVGVIPLGNAAAALEPVGGEGMGLALRSAELAVEAILESETRGNRAPIEDLPAAFNQLWHTRRAVCRGIARLFSNPAMADAVSPIMANYPGIPAAVMRWAGKR